MTVKVLSFSYCFPRPAQPTWGVFVAQRLSGMARREEVELEVVAPVPSFPLVTRLRGRTGPRREVREGLTVHRPRFFCIPGVLKSLDGRLYARGLKRWLDSQIEARRPDVLDAHFEWPDGVGVSRLAQAADLPYAITLRGWLYEAMGKPRILPQCVASLQGAAAIISVSEHLARTAVELGAPPDRMHVIPNGVDRQRFRPRDRRAARRALGLAEEGRIVVSVAHLGPRKGHREVIRAMAASPPDVRLILVGGDPEGGRNERALRELIGECGLDGRVLLAGRQPFDRVPLYYNAADVSVLASYREGCPNVVLESLASGTPVVASHVGNVAAMIDAGRNGRLVPPREVAPLGVALAELLGQQHDPEAVSRSPAVRTWDEVAADVSAVLAGAAGFGNLRAEREVGTEQRGIPLLLERIHQRQPQPRGR